MVDEGNSRDSTAFAADAPTPLSPALEDPATVAAAEEADEEEPFVLEDG